MKRLSAFVVAAFLVFSAVPFATANEASPQTATSAAVQQAININTADAATLTQLKGIGPKKAEAIVAWREANGAFTSVDQLVEVKGIGAATLEAIRADIRI